MTTYIEFGGAKRPVRFGYAALYEYEVQTGRKALSDIATLQADPQNISITIVVDLMYYGFVAGYKSTDQNVDFDKYDVADWLSERPDAMEEAVSAFFASFQQEGNAMTGPAKKAKPAPVK